MMNVANHAVMSTTANAMVLTAASIQLRGLDNGSTALELMTTSNPAGMSASRNSMARFFLNSVPRSLLGSSRWWHEGHNLGRAVSAGSKLLPQLSQGSGLSRCESNLARAIPRTTARTTRTKRAMSGAKTSKELAGVGGRITFTTNANEPKMASTATGIKPSASQNPTTSSLRLLLRRAAAGRSAGKYGAQTLSSPNRRTAGHIPRRPARSPCRGRRPRSAQQRRGRR